jgi:dihydrodipicolinate synthase/N-acetylneuraminate lyase
MKDLALFDDRLFVATLTPYLPGTEEIDEDGLRRHYRRFVDAHGAREKIGIVALPEAAEIFYLNTEEKRRILRIALEEADGKVPVVVGVSENRTPDAAAWAGEVADSGVAGLFVMPPIGAIDVANAWDVSGYPEVFIDLAQAISAAAPDLPMIVHPVGSSTPAFGFGFPADAVVKICQAVPNIVAWKMIYNYNGFRKVAAALRGLDHKVRIYPSSAPFYHEYLASDLLDGVLTGAMVYSLDQILAHIAAWRDGDIARAKAIWDGGLAQLHDYVYSTHSRLHVKYKAAAWLAGEIGSPFMRAPLPKPRLAEVAELRRLLTKVGVSVIGDDAIAAVTSQLTL